MELTVKQAIEEGYTCALTEDGKLYDKLANVDWDAVAALIDPVFTTDYYSVTNIKLIP